MVLAKKTAADGDHRRTGDAGRPGGCDRTVRTCPNAYGSTPACRNTRHAVVRRGPAGDRHALTATAAIHHAAIADLGGVRSTCQVGVRIPRTTDFHHNGAARSPHRRYLDARRRPVLQPGGDKDRHVGIYAKRTARVPSMPLLRATGRSRITRQPVLARPPGQPRRFSSRGIRQSAVRCPRDAALYAVPTFVSRRCDRYCPSAHVCRVDVGEA